MREGIGAVATRAALYARKSNRTDDGRAESVERQLEGARGAAVAMGWEVVGTFRDDFISGGLFDARAGLQALLKAAESGSFDVVVVHAHDRLGRAAEKTRGVLRRLKNARVKVWEYSNRRFVEIDGFQGGMMSDIETRFSEWYRENVREKTRHAMRSKAARGEPTGPAAFGYKNVVSNGRKAIVIHEETAAVVRMIYERYASGYGVSAIARSLNGAGVPSPRRKQPWSTTVIREILHRPTYRGRVVYGKSEMRYGHETGIPGREQAQLRTDPSTWIETPDPERQILSDEVIARVDARLEEGRRLANEGLKSGRAPHRAHSKYLLGGGLLVCPDCGGSFEMRRLGYKRKPMYVCSTRRAKPGTCPNMISLPMAETDAAILATLEGEILGGRLVREVLSVLESAPVDQTETLQSELERLRSEIRLLAESVAKGVPAESVAPLIREKEAAATKLAARLQAKPERLDRQRLLDALERQASGWIEVLRSEPAVARTLLKRLIGPVSVLERQTRAELIPLDARNRELPWVRECLWSCEVRLTPLVEVLPQTVLEHLPAPCSP